MKYLVVVAALVAVTFSPASAKTMACKKAMMREIGSCTYYMSVQRIQTNTTQRIQTNTTQRNQVNVRDPFENMHFE